MLSPATQESTGFGDQGPVSLAEAQEIREKWCRTDRKDRLGPPCTSGEEAKLTGVRAHYAIAHVPTPVPALVLSREPG